MKKILLVVAFLLIAAPVWGATYTINASTVYQSIDGFGAASNQPEDPAVCCNATQADIFFSTSSGLGLSLFRVAINADGSMNALSGAVLAQARGAKIWFAEWTPPAAYKSPRTLDGGSINPTYYQAYATQQTNSLLTAKAAGITPYAISIQNEPDISTDYDSCLWSAQNFHDYIPYLRNTLDANGLSTVKIVLPEQACWDFSYAFATMNDSSTAAMVGILAAHDYCTSYPSAPTNYGKSVWQTEVSSPTTYDGSITDGLWWATRIHNFLTLANVNAWHYWYAIDPWSDNEGLTDNNRNMAKRGYALGQFSKLVRPGWNRIDVSGSGDVLVSAYKDPNSGNFAIVAINPDSSTQSTTFSLSGLSVTTVIPWITSASLSLASQTAVSVSGSEFTYSLPASSITTFQGQEVLLPPPQNLRIILQ